MENILSLNSITKIYDGGVLANHNISFSVNAGGTVEVGKKADVILIDLNQPHLAATHNIINTIVESACARDVSDSIIDGKVIMKNRAVLTLDEERIIAQSKQCLADISKRAFG